MIRTPSVQLIKLLKQLAETLTVEDIVDESIYVNIVKDIKEGPPEDGWATWKYTGKESIRISFRLDKGVK